VIWGLGWRVVVGGGWEAGGCLLGLWMHDAAATATPATTHSRAIHRARGPRQAGPHLAAVGVDGGKLLLAALDGALGLLVHLDIVSRVAAAGTRVALKRRVRVLAGAQKGDRGRANGADDDERLLGGGGRGAGVGRVGAVVLRCLRLWGWLGCGWGW
jgi:hypothetical protein